MANSLGRSDQSPGFILCLFQVNFRYANKTGSVIAALYLILGNALVVVSDSVSSTSVPINQT